jgi:hypothetical protein
MKACQKRGCFHFYFNLGSIGPRNGTYLGSATPCLASFCLSLCSFSNDDRNPLPTSDKSHILNGLWHTVEKESALVKILCSLFCCIQLYANPSQILEFLFFFEYTIATKNSREFIDDLKFKNRVYYL